MGARHQLFVMTRINNRYRYLAGVHNQVHKGTHALERCLSLLNIFKADVNRTAIQQELIAARRCGSDIWKPKFRNECLSDSNSRSAVAPELKAAMYGGSDIWKPMDHNDVLNDSNDTTFVPFPFITTCLVLGTSFDAFKGVHSRGHILDWGYPFQEYGPNDGEWNNDGLTILDITNPQETRYCFTNLSTGYEGSRCSDDDAVEKIIPAKKPLLASSYLSAYLDKNDFQMREKARPLIQQFESHEVIDQASFKDLWEGHALDGNDSVISEPASTFNPTSDATAEEIFNDLLQHPDTMESRLQGALQDPETCKALTKNLAESSASLKGFPAILELIGNILEKEGFVYLDAFRGLSSSELCSIIARLGEQGNLTSLNLSNNVGIVNSDFVSISDHLARLQTIYLLGESQISPRTIHSVAKSPHSRLRSVYHSELLRQPFVLQDVPVDAKNTRYLENLASFPNVHPPNSVTGAIWICVTRDSNKARKPDANGGTATDWQKIATGPNLGNQSAIQFHSGLDVKYGVFPLRDIKMSPTRLVNGLISFHTFLKNTQVPILIPSSSDMGLAFAKAMATASSLTVGQSHEVVPLPGALYAAAMLMGWGRIWPFSMPKLIPGQWTILIIHEHSKYGPNKTRYALISTVAEHGNDKYRVIDMDTYLCMAMLSSDKATTMEKAQLRDHWVKNSEGLMHISEVKEVQEVLQVLKKEVAFARSHAEAPTEVVKTLGKATFVSK